MPVNDVITPKKTAESAPIRELRILAQNLEDEGKPVSAGVAHRAAERMKRMEALIVDLQEYLKDAIGSE